MGDESGYKAIEVRVDDISQLFDTLDPFPFRERDLDAHAEEFIVGWARELPRKQLIRIVVHAPQSELSASMRRNWVRRSIDISTIGLMSSRAI